MLESCPFVRSVGHDIRSGMEKSVTMCYIQDRSKFQYKTNEEGLIRATRVEQNGPYFAGSFDFIPGMPGEMFVDVEYIPTVLSEAEESEEDVFICPPPSESDDEERVGKWMSEPLAS